MRSQNARRSEDGEVIMCVCVSLKMRKKKRIKNPTYPMIL